ncbi:MBL fold metallo-hydrolase [Desulfatiglans anilini]|uniref:MBL fold metallo-hydrolase n=1 Tax=Desulfatiglans anilini TaxID=90728 RepID=UPI0003F622AE|nr:MBL fold metallo-hydrolase [Desulfatiglans anilini]
MAGRWMMLWLLGAVLWTGCAAEGQRVESSKDDKGFTDFIQWRWERLFKDIPSAEDYHFELARNDPDFLRGNRSVNTVTWIGHATLLLQIDGRNILTDPHFSRRASPVQWAGPRRVAPPGLALSDLPPIDFVLVSHDHYDSLDVGSIEGLLSRKGGERTLFVVPKGLKRWFENLGVQRVVELEWWETHTEDGAALTAVPVKHWSKRSLFSKNQSLWAGWVVRSPGFAFFFAGDSGYTERFKEIGRRLGPFDLAAIPIGAYEPRWFMRDHHMDPGEAVQVHLDVAARRSVAIHWGTFILTDEPLDEPPVRLAEALAERGLDGDVFWVLQHGETRRLP